MDGAGESIHTSEVAPLPGRPYLPSRVVHASRDFLLSVVHCKPRVLKGYLQAAGKVVGPSMEVPDIVQAEMCLGLGLDTPSHQYW